MSERTYGGYTLAEDSTFFSTVDWIVREMARNDRAMLSRLAATALHEADATVANQNKEDVLRAFAAKAQAAYEEALTR